jgi:Mn2+/Fe2+ NRAMP family transporter
LFCFGFRLSVASLLAFSDHINHLLSPFLLFILFYFLKNIFCGRNYVSRFNNFVAGSQGVQEHSGYLR